MLLLVQIMDFIIMLATNVDEKEKKTEMKKRQTESPTQTNDLPRTNSQQRL